MRGLKRACLAALLAGIATACGARGLSSDGPALALAAQDTYPGATVADLLRGRQALLSDCTGCHRLYLPAEHAAEEWRRIVPVMALKARITGDRGEDILRYVLAARRLPAEDG